MRRLRILSSSCVNRVSASKRFLLNSMLALELSTKQLRDRMKALTPTLVMVGFFVSHARAMEKELMCRVNLIRR